MQIEFLSTVSVIAADPPATRELYAGKLGVSLEGGDGGYRYTHELRGVEHFGVWPLSQAAEACFGTPEWPSDRPLPQVSIEFDLPDADAVAAAAEELRAAGCELLHPVRTEPWGQTIMRLVSPEGSIVGISYIPSMHGEEGEAAPAQSCGGGPG